MNQDQQSYDTDFLNIFINRLHNIQHWTYQISSKFIQEVCWNMDGTEFTRLSLKYKRPEQYLKEVFITLSDPDQKVLLCDDQNFPKNLCNF